MYLVRSAPRILTDRDCSIHILATEIYGILLIILFILDYPSSPLPRYSRLVLFILRCRLYNKGQPSYLPRYRSDKGCIVIAVATDYSIIICNVASEDLFAPLGGRWGRAALTNSLCSLLQHQIDQDLVRLEAGMSTSSSSSPTMKLASSESSLYACVSCTSSSPRVSSDPIVSAWDAIWKRGSVGGGDEARRLPALG